MTGFLLRGLLFILPFFLFYLAVKVLRARSKGETLDPATLRMIRFSVVAIVLSVLVAAFWRWDHKEADPTMKYIPPHMEDGRLMPGHFEEKSTPS